MQSIDVTILCWGQVSHAVWDSSLTPFNADLGLIASMGLHMLVIDKVLDPLNQQIRAPCGPLREAASEPKPA